MKIWHSLVAAVTAVSLSCSVPSENDVPQTTELPQVAPAAVTGGASIGNAVTVSDNGWQRLFGGSITVESDATIIYAVVFGGTGGKAPVIGVSVGSQPLAKVKSATGPYLSMDVYRLATPITGSARSIVVTRSALGYDPVRVTVFTVRGANAADPNGPMTALDITPNTATATKTVNITSRAGALTVSAVVAAPAYVNVTGVTATPGFQTVAASGEDTDGGFGVIGVAPGSASITHSWNLKADAAGRPAFLVSFSINTGGTTSSSPPVVVTGAATFGTVVTLNNTGGTSSFAGSINVESDANVMYAVVFNGTGSAAPVSGVSVGGRALTRIKSAERTTNASLDVFRLVTPPTGAQGITVSRVRIGYDPVRVSVFTVRGGNASDPNGAVTEVDITPSTATATRSVTVLSSTDGLTISAVAASGMYVNGTGVTATPGFQATRASGEDADGIWGVLGSAPGAASVVHSYNLKADAAGRSAYLISFTVNGPNGTPPPPPPVLPTPLPPPPSAGWTSALNYDVAQLPPPAYENYQGWTAYARPWEQMYYTNMTLIQDATQPSGNAGAARITFLSTLPGGYAPINFQYGGTWPANSGSIDVSVTIKLPTNWDNNGPLNTNAGTKLFFFATEPQNNHFLGLDSRRYDGAPGGGTGTLGGAWVTVGLQNPTVSYKTNIDLTRGAWHTIRMQAIANTPGTANGQLRVWVDGVPALINSGKNDAPVYDSRTNVMFFSSGQTARQNRLEFEPTYGGGYESPPYTQWLDIGHVYAAVK